MSTEDAIRVTARSPRGAQRHPARRGGRFPIPTELLVWLISSLAVLIAGQVSDIFDGYRVWLLFTILSAAYMIGRGLAKFGRDRDDDMIPG